MLFAVAQNIPSPYRLHMFRAMRTILAERGWDFEVHFMSEGHAGRPDSWRNPEIDFPHRYWPDHGRGTHHFNPGMIRHLVKRRPDVLLVGSTFDTFTGIALSALRPAPVMCAWSEGNTKTPGVMDGFKGWLKRAVFARYGFVAVPGSDAIGYIGLHQARTRKRMPKPVFLPNIVDETQFGNADATVLSRRDAEISEPQRGTSKECLCVSEASASLREKRRTCLIPARPSPEKGIVPMLSLVEKEWLEGWRIVIAGQGPEEAAIRAVAAERGFADKVEIRPYVPYAEMPAVYAQADLMLLPSIYDRNPLCVVEALHAGLPIALSDRAGNVEEAVTENREKRLPAALDGSANGWRLDVRNPSRFKEQLCEVFATDSATLRRMGETSRTVNARFWDTRQSITNFLDPLLAAAH